jgi:hypothetical protein
LIEVAGVRALRPADGVEFATAGRLLSYGPNYAEAYRQVGDYLGRVLNGEKPGNLPVQQVTKLEPVINMRTARALGAGPVPQQVPVMFPVFQAPNGLRRAFHVPKFTQAILETGNSCVIGWKSGTKSCDHRKIGRGVRLSSEWYGRKGSKNK